MLFRSAVLILAVSIYGICGYRLPGTVLPDATTTVETDPEVVPKREWANNFLKSFFFDDSEEDDGNDRDDADPVTTTKQPEVVKPASRGRKTRDNDWPLTPNVTEALNHAFSILADALNVAVKAVVAFILKALGKAKDLFSN